MKGCIYDTKKNKKKSELLLSEKKKMKKMKKRKKMNKTNKYDCRDALLDKFPLNYDSKVAALKAAQSVVLILARGFPAGGENPESDTHDNVTKGTGTIIECQDAGDGTFSATILAPATAVARMDGRPTEVVVYLSDGKLCKGEIIDCDFHYNLAVIRIQADSPLKAATFRSIDDTLSDNTLHCPLAPHSDKFKTPPGTKVLFLQRLYGPPSYLHVGSGLFCTHVFSGRYDCKELYWLKTFGYNGDNGAAVVNYSGEVIGILFDDRSFLPSNIVSRWWNHYNSYRKFCRPWHGVEVANLHAVRLDFSEPFNSKFPGVTDGVIVTKIEKDSPAYSSGVRLKDVITKCGGKSVRTKLEFFEYIWDHAGQPVELTVLRVEDGRQLNLSMTTGELTSDKFNEALAIRWTR